MSFVDFSVGKAGTKESVLLPALSLTPGLEAGLSPAGLEAGLSTAGLVASGASDFVREDFEKASMLASIERIKTSLKRIFLNVR